MVPHATTAGPTAQTSAPLTDTRIPYRVTFVETRYHTLDVLAADAAEAEAVAAENSEYALEADCIGWAIARTGECFAPDFSAINE